MRLFFPQYGVSVDLAKLLFNNNSFDGGTRPHLCLFISVTKTPKKVPMISGNPKEHQTENPFSGAFYKMFTSSWHFEGERMMSGSDSTIGTMANFILPDEGPFPPPSILPHSSETWPLGTEELRRLSVPEHRCLCSTRFTRSPHTIFGDGSWSD